MTFIIDRNPQIRMRQQALAQAAPLPVRVILRTVWDDLGEIWARLRGQSIIAFALVVVIETIGALLGISANPWLSETFNFASMVATLPFEIAICRLLILDEATPGYRFAISSDRFRRVLGWNTGVWVLVTIPGYLAGAGAPFEAIAAVVNLITVIVGIVVIVRLSLFVPAIAVDAPVASVGNAFADTRGHGWLIVKAFFAVALPFIVVVIAAAVLASITGHSDDSGLTATVGSGVLFGIMGFFVVCAATIVPARLFMRLGDRLKGTATPTATARPDY
jgi:hypothetical protein